MKLQRLQPRLKAATESRLPVANIKPDMVERKRGSAGVKDRNNIKARDCGLCQACKRMGRAAPGHVVDHIIPLWDGGSDADGNKETLCTPCHNRKTAGEARQRAGY